MDLWHFRTGFKTAGRHKSGNGLLRQYLWTGRLSDDGGKEWPHWSPAGSEI